MNLNSPMTKHPANNDGYMVKLRNARRKRGLTQSELAQLVGVTTNYISLIEKGKKNPSTKTLKKLALALDVPVSSFLEDNLRMELISIAEQYDFTEIISALEWFKQTLERHQADK